jgi:hypothetical protein
MRTALKRPFRVQMLLRAERTRAPVAIHTSFSRQATYKQGLAQYVYPILELV